jgi:hypothetical protein
MRTELKLSKKGQVNKLQTLGLGVVITGAAVGVGAYVLSRISAKIGVADANQTSAGVNISVRIIGNFMDALLDLAVWVGILIVAGVGGMAIYWLIKYIGGR